MKKMRDYSRWHDYMNYIIKCTVISVSKTFRRKTNSLMDLLNSTPHLFLSQSKSKEVVLDLEKNLLLLDQEVG